MNGMKVSGKKHKLVIERSKAKILPHGRNQRNKYRSELCYFRKISEGFMELWTECWGKFDLAKGSSTTCEKHKDYKACLQKRKKESETS